MSTISKPTLFAVFDVLGTSSLTLTGQLDKVERIYKKLKRISNLIIPNERHNYWIAEYINRDIGVELIDYSQAHIIRFSDSVFFMDEYIPMRETEYFDMSVCARFGEFCRQFVCECIRAGIPIRGSIALGEAKIDSFNNVPSSEFQ